MKSRKFVDTVALYAKAGTGGNGSASFRREKNVPRGGPDGGDGGHGGHVILQADPDTTSLVHIYFSPHQSADNGGHGRGQQQHGRSGKDLLVKVPCGTEAWDKSTKRLLADIVAPGSKFVAARGGKGGLGNVHWKSSKRQAPTEHTAGEPGEEIALRLELKLVADVGFVGFPNAGKSSLLTGVSDAHPKIGAYPFTTLNPIIGTLIFEDYSRTTLVDVPGLVTGAHEGVGLGHRFLRHIERCSALIIVLDMAGVDGRQADADYTGLLQEITLHKKNLIQRPSLVVANKMDLPQSKARLTDFIKKTNITPIQVSALTGQGCDELKQAIYKIPRRS